MPLRSAPAQPRASVSDVRGFILHCICLRRNVPVPRGPRGRNKRTFGISCATGSLGSSSSSRSSYDKGDEEDGTMQGGKQGRSRMTELAQSLQVPPPVYTLISESGPPHLKKFRYQVTLNNATVAGDERSTKSAAKEAAAVMFLSYYQSWFRTPQSVVIDEMESEMESEEESERNKRSYGQSMQDSSFRPSVETLSTKSKVARDPRLPKVEMKECGALVLIDLDNLPKTVTELDDYLAANKDHNVCEVTAYASLAFNPGKALPEYVQFRKAESLDRDSADILMVFETALRLGELVGGGEGKKKLSGVVILSKDHFATRLKEILCSYKVRCHHVVTTPDLIQRLQDM